MTYVDVAGVSTYYEVSGQGDPVVMLHGALSGADGWSLQVPALVSAGFSVWLPERRGHGHTPDTSEPFSYRSMALETAAFLHTVVGQRCHLVGWSDGAVVAALVAMTSPELVDRVVLIGQYYDLAGALPDGLTGHLIALRDDPPGFLRGSYDQVSPDGPEHFVAVYAKTVAMISTEPQIALTELAAIAAPTLVLQGDRDEVRLEHSVAVAAAIPQARLAVLPGTHALPIESPSVVNALLVDFLRGGPHDINWRSLAELAQD